MTNPTKPALDLDELEAAAKVAMSAHPNDDYFLFDDLVTPPTVLALIEAAKERDTLRVKLAQAREALEPFAGIGKHVPNWAKDDEIAEGPPFREFHPTFGEIRRARQALAAITLAASTEDKP